MIQRIKYLASFAILLTVSCASEISLLIDNLDSDDYGKRQSARLELRQVLLGAPGSARDAMELELLGYVEKSHPFSVRDWSIRMLELMGSDQAVEPLSNLLLDDDDAVIRDCVRRALMANPAVSATRALEHALQNAEASDQAGMLDALAYRRDPHSVQFIVPLLKSGSPELASKAALCLGKIKGAAAEAALTERYSASSGLVREEIELALISCELTNRNAARYLALSGQTEAIRIGAYMHLISLDPGVAAEVLNEVLGDSNFPGRVGIVGATARSSISAELIKQLGQLSAEIQVIVLRAIAEENLSEYESSVLALLNAEPDSVKEAAASALGVIGSDQSYEPLYKLYLEDPENEVFSMAIARLKAPSADTNLFIAARDAGDLEAQILALQLLSIRYSKGVTSLVNELSRAENNDKLREAVFKTMETVGDLESVGILLSAVMQQDALTRLAQSSLKKLSSRIGAPDFLWTEYYAPALGSAPDDGARKAVLAVLDGISGAASAAYLERLIVDGSPLKADALKSLSRWTDISAAKVWCAIYEIDDLSEADRSNALRALKRLFSQKHISGGTRAKVKLAAKLIREASTIKVKEAILSGYDGKKLGWEIEAEIKKSFKPLLGDPEIAQQVQDLLDKVS